MSEQSRFQGGSAVFEVRSRTFTMDEVLQAADFRGELRPRCDEILVAAACARKAEDLGLEASTDTLQTMSEDFRYERNLVTAEETEQWLEQRDLTLTDFDQFFLRRYWKAEMEDPPEPEILDLLSVPLDLLELLKTDLVMSGEFFRMAAQLGRRAATLAVARGAADPSPDAVEDERARLLKRTGLGATELPGWLATRRIGPAWIDELLRMEAVYRAQCAAIFSPQARQRVLSAMRLPLTRIEFETIELESLDPANEALLCIREDGTAMADLAQRCRYPYRKIDLFLDQMSQDQQQRFLAAAPGEVVQPVEDGERYLLSRLLRKIAPDLSDARVGGRVDERILDAHFAALTAKEVRWLVRDETGA